MKTHTYTLQLDISRQDAFEFLSNIENLPKCAPMFCQKVIRSDGDVHTIATVAGEIFFKIDADAETGVVDMYGGPNLEQMSYWPARVIARPDGKCLYTLTVFQFPYMTEQDFDTQCRAIAHGLPNVKREIEN